MRYTVVMSETEADHVVPIISMADTTVSELIDDDLFFLLPFFSSVMSESLKRLRRVLGGLRNSLQKNGGLQNSMRVLPKAGGLQQQRWACFWR